MGTLIVIIGGAVIFMLLGGIVVIMANMLGIILVITCWSQAGSVDLGVQPCRRRLSRGDTIARVHPLGRFAERLVADSVNAAATERAFENRYRLDD